MADPKGRLLRIGDWGLDVQIPNPALQEWLNSEECERALAKIAADVRRAYVNYLPRRRGVLKGGAFQGVGRRTPPGGTQRWYAWVGNRALSYRATKGQPYPRFIEYGKANTDGTRTGGGYQLHNAALLVARGRSAAAYAAATAYLGGGNFNPEMHKARPAVPKSEIEKMRAAAKAPQSVVDSAARTRRRNEIARRRAERSGANINRAVQRSNLEKSLKPKPEPKQK